MCLGGEEATDCYCSEVLKRKQKVNELNAELPAFKLGFISLYRLINVSYEKATVATRCKTLQLHSSKKEKKKEKKIEKR